MKVHSTNSTGWPAIDNRMNVFKDTLYVAISKYRREQTRSAR